MARDLTPPTLLSAIATYFFLQAGERPVHPLNRTGSPHLPLPLSTAAFPVFPLAISRLSRSRISAPLSYQGRMV